jgi:hypothetical protein
MHRLLDDLVVAPFRELQFLAAMRRGVARVPPTVHSVTHCSFAFETSPARYQFYRGRELPGRRSQLGNPVISIERDADAYGFSKVLEKTSRPALLWLDGDPGAGHPARRHGCHQILLWLGELKEQTVRSHSLLINGAGSFDGRNSRPDLLQILTAVRAIHPDYRIKIESDIIVALLDRTTSFYCGWKVHLSSRIVTPSSTNHQHPSPNRTRG